MLTQVRNTMSKTKPTPGPWKAIKYQNINAWMICKTNQVTTKIAELSESTDCEALGMANNAHLIAAAPEMLEALAACHDILLMDPKHEAGRAVRLAKEAIKKAKGE
jgi:hypothetical protein